MSGGASTATATTNPKVEFFFQKAGQWQDEYRQLRTLVLDCGLTEDLKWGCPCYTFDNKNIVLIHGFKEYCALLFFKGALLKDHKQLLTQQTENVQSARQFRFASSEEITKRTSAIKAFIKEAIAVEQAGLKVELKKTAEFPMPDELQLMMGEMPKLKTAFHALTPGRQRAYLLHFAAPKQSKTRTSRIEKAIPQILSGKGLNDE